MMKAYPKYKDSGVPWLEHVPAHWEFKRSKSVFRTIDVRSAEGQEELLSVSEKNGVALRKNTNVTMFQAASYAGYKLCWPNDLVINSLWAWMTGLGFSKYHGIISTAYSVFRIWNQGKFDSDYGNYLLRSKTYNWEFRVRSKGIWRSRYQLADDSFLSMPLLIPPLNEQQQISRYLDWQTSKINKFIKAKKRLIALLKEQKQNVINEAVTKGINPDAPVKDSGVEWIGDIPEHWEVRRLKFLCHNLNEQTSEKQPGETYIALEHVESWTGRISLPDDEITFDSQVKRFQPGDVLFGKLRPYLAKVTRPQTAGVCVGEFLVLRATGDVSADFLEQKLRSKRVIDLINSSTFGAKMPRADWTFIGNLKFAYPPADEQREILEHIQEKSAEIDQAISRAQREIELMREYRTRLISDVVTGQVDVRNVKCEGGSLNEDEFEDIEEVEEEIELPEGGEDDE